MTTHTEIMRAAEEKGADAAWASGFQWIIVPGVLAVLMGLLLAGGARSSADARPEARPDARTGWIVAAPTTVEVNAPGTDWWKWAWSGLDAVHGQAPHTQAWGTVVVRNNVAYIESTGRKHP